MILQFRRCFVIGRNLLESEGAVECYRFIVVAACVQPHYGVTPPGGHAHDVLREAAAQSQAAALGATNMRFISHVCSSIRCIMTHPTTFPFRRATSAAPSGAEWVLGRLSN